MNISHSDTSEEGSYPDGRNTHSQTGRKILPLEGVIQKKVSKSMLSLDYDWRLKRDKGWLEIEDEIIPRRKKKQPKYSISDEQKLIFEEMTENIVNDLTLSQTYGNPNWYRPIPVYTHPNGIKRTATYIRAFKKLQEENAKTTSPAIFVSENFGAAWVYTSNTPITLDEWELYNVASFPYVSPENFYIHLTPLTTTQGVTVRKLYSYPNIVERVKWFVTFCCTEKGSEILGMYCYRNRKAIEEITEFLADTPVINDDDKNEAVLSLSEIYHKIS